jgi:hypothetical protein
VGHDARRLATTALTQQIGNAFDISGVRNTRRRYALLCTYYESIPGPVPQTFGNLLVDAQTGAISSGGEPVPVEVAPSLEVTASAAAPWPARRPYLIRYDSSDPEPGRLLQGGKTRSRKPRERSGTRGPGHLGHRGAAIPTWNDPDTTPDSCDAIVGTRSLVWHIRRRTEGLKPPLALRPVRVVFSPGSVFGVSYSPDGASIGVSG